MTAPLIIHTAAPSRRPGPEPGTGYSLPARQLFRRESIGESKGYEVLRAGDADSFLLGARRHIVLASWWEYLDRLRRGVERDPEAKAEAARRYAETAAQSRVRYAPKHGTASGPPSKTGPKASDCLEVSRTSSPPYCAAK
jgi:hypothetical protein